MGAASSVPHRSGASALPSNQSESPFKRGGATPQDKEGRRSKRMDKLRKSFRESFRKRRDLRSGVRIPDAVKPLQWQEDEASVRDGTCSFPVKYLGCIQVYESRGMDVCEEALKQLRGGRRKLVKGILHVSGDGLRVVDDDTNGLIVDQTIEKVSFCAPDRNHERGFSYICRDGTTRRWMCHGFLAMRDSGERLSHAVGCAFALCLERKQQRDKDCTVAMTFDSQGAFTRLGSFRAVPITERIQDPQEVKVAEPPPVKPVVNPFAIERPHATPYMLERQGSFRGFPQLNSQAPFKRQLSLRLSDLPSTLERARQIVEEEQQQQAQQATSPGFIDLKSPANENAGVELDELSALAQQVTQGLSLLSGGLEESFDETFSPEKITAGSTFSPLSNPESKGVFGAMASPNGGCDGAALSTKAGSPFNKTRRAVPDPFDAEWAGVVSPTAVGWTSPGGAGAVTSPQNRTESTPVSRPRAPTNPFLIESSPLDFTSPAPQKAFEIHM